MLSPGGGVAGVGVTIGGAVGTAGSAEVSGSGGSTPIDQGPVNHRFLSSVAGDGPLAIVSDSGAIEWRIDIKGQANDAWLLPSGNVLYAYMSGVREVTVQKTVAWDYPAPEGSEIHGCQPLENGRYLIGETHGGGLAYLRELDSAGVVQGTVTVQPKRGSARMISSVRCAKHRKALTWSRTWATARRGSSTARGRHCGSFRADHLWRCACQTATR